MTFLPIVARELRVTARRAETYWIRCGAALFGVCLAGWVLLATLRDPPYKVGSALFMTLSIFAFIYALLAGVRVTSDCLSEEKREGTLGLLFLTDLKGYDVVFGKLAATSLHAFYGMISFFPVLAISLLLGGVSWTQFAKIILVCGNTLFFSLACGIFASSISRDERKAMGATFLFLLIFSAGFPVLANYLNYETSLPKMVAGMFLLPSPGFTLFAGFNPGMLMPGNTLMPREAFWISLTVVHCLAWLFIFLASWTVPRTWQDRGIVTARKGWRFQIQQWCYGNPTQRTEFRRRLLGINPILWLTSRNRVKTALVWWLLVISAALWYWGYLEHGSDWLFEGTYIFTAVALHSVFKLWAIAEACKRFSEDRNSGAMELLLATPLSVREILDGQVFSLLRQFGRPGLLVLAMDFVFLVICVQGNSGAERLTYLITFLTGMIIFAADFFTICWVGMWMAMNTRRLSQATSGVFARILVLPWLLYGACMVTIVILDEFLHVRIFDKFGSYTGIVFVLFWFFLSVLVDMAFGLRAIHGLHRNFRTLAMERFLKRKWRFPWSRSNTVS